MWGIGQRGNKAACLALILLSVTSLLPTSEWHPFSCYPDADSPSGRAFVHCRTIFVHCGPLHWTLERLTVSPTAANPTGFYSQRFWGFMSALEPQVVWSALLLSCSSWFICTWMWDCLVHYLLPCWVSCHLSCLISTPPINVDECFFFHSLVVRLPYGSIIWQFFFFLFNWLFPPFGCVRRWSVFTYTSILASSSAVKFMTLYKILCL